MDTMMTETTDAVKAANAAEPPTEPSTTTTTTTTPAEPPTASSTETSAATPTEPSTATPVTAHGAALSMDAEELTRRLDRINLTQALLDFEIANARVLDLTSRVVDSNKRVLKLQAEADASRVALEGARADIAELARRIAEVEESTTYKAAQKLGSLRRLLHRLRN